MIDCRAPLAKTRYVAARSKATRQSERLLRFARKDVIRLCEEALADAAVLRDCCAPLAKTECRYKKI